MKNKEKINCKYCGSGGIVKRGFRGTKTGKRQIYYCKDCQHRFSANFLNQKKFNPNVIIEAVCKYNLGYSCSEVVDIVRSRYKISVGESSVSRWANELDCPYLKVRNDVIKRYGRSLIISKMFKHSGLIYHFKFHKAKLMQFGKFSGLKEFIISVADKGIDNRIFNDSNNNRCSQIKFNVNIKIDHTENKFLNRFVYSVLKGCNNNNKRHSIVEKFLLCCDRDTAAVEVPVWYWDKGKSAGVCRHVDILQVKYGKVWIMDFKPNAVKENVDSVVSQLWLYARALSFRANVELSDIKCCWFDWNDVYSFNPCEVRIR